jgi:small subunit ribosomal protein S17
MTDASSTDKPESSSAEVGERGNSRKVREGLVLSAKMDKTVIVGVTDRVRHRRYGKTLQRTRRFYAHDETNDAREGDRVRIAETRPLSRLKRWRLVEVLERAR